MAAARIATIRGIRSNNDRPRSIQQKRRRRARRGTRRMTRRRPKRDIIDIAFQVSIDETSCIINSSGNILTLYPTCLVAAVLDATDKEHKEDR
jgi:hypothetical protein